PLLLDRCGGGDVYAIRNKKTGKWLYGTDFRFNPRRQLTSYDAALTFGDRQSVELDFQRRGCGKD
ncbi:hypothetical protein, partial [Xylanibacillus composti]|uniref:hypothetical protein n=1 Tax=Xylanibacillus composti TaxID=1572762 RepID=UPI001BCEFB50